jgi:hypothetical protein
MARGKHAAALFEVINKGKKEETSRGSILRTPSWWFKNRTATAKQPPAAPAQPAHPVQGVPPAQSAPAPADVPTTRNDPAAGGSITNPAPTAAAATAATQSSASPATATPAPAVAVDPAHRQIALRLSYTTAGIAAFAVLVTVSLAYIIGRQVTTGPAPAIAARSTEQVRQDEPQPQVLDINRGRNASGIPPAQQPQISAHVPTHQSPQNVQPTPAPPPPTAVVEDDGPRTIGLNYVIIQSYRDEEMARRYAQMLNQGGVRCTVEQDLPNWSQGGPWYSIVGTSGFARIRNSPEYDSYIQSIRRINDSNGLTGFRRFDPQPYHWKGTR